MRGLFELIYYAGYRIKTRSDLKNARSLDVPVISIGNITTGGTGKTPATIALARRLKQSGLRPCILTRGYKGRAEGPLLVSSEMYEADVGDEPLLMAESLKDVPVVKGADRYMAGLFAIENLNAKPDVFILDDGFQHRRLQRDVDIVLINARDPFDNERLLPMGMLREPLGQLARADIIVITKAFGAGDEIDTASLLERIAKYNSTAGIFVSGHRPTCLIKDKWSRRRQDSKAEKVDLKRLHSKKVFAFCGIAEPASFRGMLLSLGAEVVGMEKFRDHHKFTQEDAANVAETARNAGAEWIITTEKDIMRLRALGDLPDNLYALSIEFSVDDSYYEAVLGRLGCTA